jgi:hypothetical protein
MLVEFFWREVGNKVTKVNSPGGISSGRKIRGWWRRQGYV